jgi:hypothetical protein
MPTNDLEPLYTLKQAAELVPMRSVDSLKHWLTNHANDWPRRYRQLGRCRQWVRLLTESELVAIRQRLVRTGYPARISRKGIQSSVR